MRNRLVVFGIAAMVAALGARAAADIGFDTGTIRGTVATTGGVVPPSATVQARSNVDGSQATAFVDPATGEYLLQGIPVGDYTLEAYYQNALVGSAAVSLSVGEDETHNFPFAAGVISAHVSRNGVNDVNASMQVQDAETPPGCSAPGVTCQGAGVDFCACTFENRFYTCDPMNGCRYMMRYFFQASTGADGIASVLVPAGLWDVAVYHSSTFMPDGHGGSVRVGAVFGTSIPDGGSVTALDASYDTAIVTGVVTANGTPLTGVVVTASTSAGQIGAGVDANGAYSLTLPTVAAYTISAVQDGATTVGSYENVMLTPGATTNLDFAITGATVSGDVLQDGVPAANAAVYMLLAPPSSCGAGECGAVDPAPGDGCFCHRDDHPYVCDPAAFGGICRWLMPIQLSTYTDPSGHFEKFLAPGTYEVQVATAPSPGMSQFGQITVARQNVVIDATPVGLGTFSYSTGEISGVATSCAQPLLNASITAANANGSIGTMGTMSDGSFLLRLPEGDYAIRAELFGAQFDSTQRTITASTAETWAVDVDLGGIRGAIERDGQPSQFSQVQVTEIPEGLACNATCGFNDPVFGVCSSCTHTDGRTYGCYPMGPSNTSTCLLMLRYYSGSTGQDGIFQIDNMAPGLYHVVAQSGGAGGPGGPGGGGQTGGITVGAFDVRVEACDLTSINVADTPVPAGANVSVELGTGITLNFDNVTAGTAFFNATSTPPPAEPTPAFQSAGLYYDIVVPGHTGNVEVCLPYDLETATTDLHLYHSVGGIWVDITTSVDTVNHIVCGNASSFSWFAVGGTMVTPPTLSITGPAEVTADATCHGSVTLHGAGSYAWFLDGSPLGSGTTMTIAELPLGPNTITATSGTATATATVTVVDETPPALNIAASPAVLWPPNGKLVTIGRSGNVTDNCGAPTVTVLGVASTSAAPTDIVQTPTSLQLRAFRDGKELGGRSYVVTYAATDAAGNSTTATSTVTVPHDKR